MTRVRLSRHWTQRGWRGFYTYMTLEMTGSTSWKACASVLTSEFGSRPPELTYFDNHASALLDSEFISSYIAGEQEAGRYSRSFEPAELEAIIGPFRTSPLGLVPKPHTDTFRMIQDMSFPRDSSTMLSINAGICSDDFPTTWGTFDSTSALILTLPEGCRAATFDISAAYRITPIRPWQQSVLCVYWKGRVYVDRALMFGLSSSAGVFGSVADMLVAIYERAGFGPIRKWVDDFFVILLPGASWTEEDFISLTGAWGVPWSRAKTRPLAVVQRFIGFDWDLRRRTVALPAEKLFKIQSLISQWLTAGHSACMREAASLHGKLVHISCIYPLVRPFLRSISAFAAAFISPRAKLPLPSSVSADLSWIQFLLASLPNEMPLASPSIVDIQWWGDASTSFGIGIAIGQFWAVWKWAPGFKVGPKQDFDIGWAEAVAVELGFRIAVDRRLLVAASPALTQFLVRSDNSGIVAVTNKGRSRSRETNQVLKHIYQLQARQGVRIHAEYVSTRDNIADALSRGDVAGFLAGFPSVTTQVSLPLPSHLVGKLVPW